MSILPQLNEQAEYNDLEAMNTLVESLSPAERSADSQAIIDVYELVFRWGMYDLDCNQVPDRQEFIFFLLRLIDSIQRFFPGQQYYHERGRCYGYLADCVTAYEDKLQYLQQCLHFFSSAPQTTGVQFSMVRALINKMEITQQFTTEAFTGLLSFFRPVLNDPALVKEVIYQCFRVRSLPFEQNMYWFQLLLAELESALHELATSHPLVYLDWAEALHFLLYTDTDEIYTGYKPTMVTQTVLLLKPLEGYYTEDADILYRLGKAFADTARSSPDYELKLGHYKTAYDFFKKSHEQHPQGIWTYPVYAIITLYDIAAIYNEQGAHEKVIDTFEQGLQLFSKAPNPATDYTLNQYWGDFLIKYSGVAYDYQSPDINRRAEEKLRLAMQLILEYQSHPYFSRPYFSLAKLAIKSGDKEKCVSVLLQCKEAIRAKGFPGYHLQDALEEEDFREVWERLDQPY